MPKIHKVVTTVWYNKNDMHSLRQVFPDARFVYVDFFDKQKLAEEVRDADVAILMGDVDPACWVRTPCNGSTATTRVSTARPGQRCLPGASRSPARRDAVPPVLAEHCIYFMLQS